MIFYVYRYNDMIQNLPRKKIKQKETRIQWNDSFKWLKEKKKKINRTHRTLFVKNILQD